jgi:hypothetical protein
MKNSHTNLIFRIVKIISILIVFSCKEKINFEVNESDLLGYYCPRECTRNGYIGYCEDGSNSCSDGYLIKVEKKSNGKYQFSSPYYFEVESPDIAQKFEYRVFFDNIDFKKINVSNVNETFYYKIINSQFDSVGYVKKYKNSFMLRMYEYPIKRKDIKQNLIIDKRY